MRRVLIYTDGACSGNPGAGGWGAILMYDGNKKEICGGVANTTNNQMEITAAIEALKQLKEPCEVTLYSDSAYLINSFQQHWLEGWKSRNWHNSRGDAVKNKELWQELDSLAQPHKITWIKVKGHSNDALNNRCDELARGCVINVA